MSTKAVATFAVAITLALASAGLVLGATSRPNEVFLPSVSCADCGGTGSVSTPIPTTPPDTSAYASRVIELVNRARAAVGCPAVTPHPILMSGAQAWSETMARTQNYVHSPGNYYQTLGYPGGGTENIAGGAETPDYAFDGWMESAPHRYNLQWCYPTSDPSYDPARVYEVGVGFQDGYWTLTIGHRLP